jgi:ribose-phosphate pyrophosphokinase
MWHALRTAAVRVGRVAGRAGARATTAAPSALAVVSGATQSSALWWMSAAGVALAAGTSGVAAEGAAPAPATEPPAAAAKPVPDEFPDMILFTGNANPALAKEIAGLLGKSLGEIRVGRFADGETSVRVLENVRGKDVFVVQPTCQPVNEHLMELLLMISTMRRASADKITAIIPYYGYARQDRKMTSRVPISAADVARLLEALGVDRVVAVDLHSGQIQGFFGPRVPVDNLEAGFVSVEYFARKGLVSPVIVSPDAGGVYRAKTFREALAHRMRPAAAGEAAPDVGLAMIIKQRPRAGEIERMDLVGTVEGSDCIIVDDMIDTAGTLATAAAVLKENGARRVFAMASHGLFSGPASERIARSQLEEVVVTNTVPLNPDARTNAKIVQLSVATLLAETIKRVHTKRSVSQLFKQNTKE